MSDAATKEAEKKTSETTKETASAEPKPDQTAENPQREWIDTLLTAAAMTRSKTKNTGKDEGKGSESSPSTTAQGNSAESSNPKDAQEASPMAQTGKPTGDDGMETKASVDQENEANDQDDSKRYRRRRCEVPDCTKFARFNNACSGHGGRRLCSQPGCKRVAQFGHKCSAHGGVKYCSTEGCKRAVQSRGFCKTHGGGVRCKHSGCEKGAISKGHCRAHGGGSRCAEDGCQKWAQRHGFCVRHSKAASGTTEEEEAADVNSAQV